MMMISELRVYFDCVCELAKFFPLFFSLSQTIFFEFLKFWIRNPVLKIQTNPALSGVIWQAYWNVYNTVFFFLSCDIFSLQKSRFSIRSASLLPIFSSSSGLISIWLISVKSVVNLNRRNRYAMAILRLVHAYRLPMQFRGPAENGIYWYGCQWSQFKNRSG